MDSNLWVMLAAALVVAVSAILQGSVGFGFSIVAAPFLLLLEPRLVPGPLLLAGMTLVLLLTLRERRSIDRTGLKWAFVGLVPGASLGAILLAVLPQPAMALLFGGLVLLAVVLSLAGLRLRPSPSVLIGAGLLSGIMSSTSSISGPPLALIYQHKPGASLRGTLSGYFLGSTIFSIIALNGVGRFGYAELGLALPLLPGVVVGFFLSRHTITLLDRGYTRPAVLLLSAAAALVIILRNIL